MGSCFFFNDTATTEIYTLSLHDALPISALKKSAPSSLTALRTSESTSICMGGRRGVSGQRIRDARPNIQDRKSTRLNSSHANISYAVFCLKKKKHSTTTPRSTYS